MNDAGQVAFTVGLDSGISKYQLCVSDGTTTSTVGNIGALDYFETPVINNNGQVVFMGGVKGEVNVENWGLYRSDGSTLTTIRPDAGGGDLSMNDSGTVAFYAESAIPGNGRAIYMGSGGPASLVADGGDFPFSNLPNNELGSTSINEEGIVAFRARTGPTETGIFVGNETAFSPFYTGSWRNVLYLDMNDSGTIAFLSGTGPGSTGIFASDGTSVNTIAMSGSVFSQFGAPDINDSGQVVFKAQLTSSLWGIFRGSDPVEDAVIKPGDLLDGSTVTGVNLDPNRNVFNDNGQVAFLATLADGRKGIYRATPVPDPDPNVIPEPSSIIVWSLIGLSFAGVGWWRKRKR